MQLVQYVLRYLAGVVILSWFLGPHTHPVYPSGPAGLLHCRPHEVEPCSQGSSRENDRVSAGRSSQVASVGGKPCHLTRNWVI
ncbi:hypothetical protein KY285_016311 [Solanum tuberosum]|nr:hypothetical protein KY285_016311 [Solanum tuberosum]